MKPRRLSVARLSFPLASALAALLAASAPKAEAQLFYKSTTAANSWTGNFWGSSAAGPFTGAWVAGSNVTFVANGGTALALTGATTQFASITADENVNVTASGTLGTGGTVATVTVASGKNMNFGTQSISTAAGTGLIKNGPGILTLAGGTYAGGFTLNAGTVAVGGVNAMGAGGSLTINGGTIRSNGTNARDLSGKYANGGIVIGGDFTLGDATNNGALTFTNSMALGAATRTITVNSGVTFGGIGVISGAANVGLTKAGTGTLTLNGTNTYDGVVTINAGTLAINTFTNGGVAGSLGMSSNAASNLVLNGGGLTYSGGSTSTDRGMTFSALTGSLTLSVSTAGSNLNLTSAIVGTPGQQIDFTKGGGGTLTLSNDNNSFIGRTMVNAGTLAVTSISAVGAGNSSLGVATTAADGLISLGTGATGGTLSYVGTGTTTDRNLDLPGTTGGGTISQSGTGLLSFTGSFGASGAGSKTLTLTGSTAGTGEIASVIADNSVTNTTAVTKTGTGSWTLSGASSYTGATTVSAGTLVVTGSLASNVTIGGGTFDLGGGTAGGSLSSPTLTLNAGTFSYTRTGGTTQVFTTTNVNGPSQLSVVSGNTLDLGTIVRGTGGTLDFSAVGAGTVSALVANNVNGIMPGFSYGDTWAVANGAGVAISGLGTYTLTSVAGTTGTNYLNANVDVDNNAGLIDAAIAANSVRFSGAAANTLTLAAGTNTVAGGILVGSTVGGHLSTISGGSLTGEASQNLAIIQNNTSGGLTLSSTIVDNTLTSVTKSGAGVLTLDAANTYTGGTTVAAGTLKLAGAGTPGPAAASVAVNSGALLDLNGTNQSITLAAGSGVGTVANNSGSGVSVLTLKTNAAPDGGFLTIADNTTTPGGKVAVVITTNTQIPSNLNSYSGGTTVNAGAFYYLNVSTPNGAGTGPIDLPAAGGTTATSSGLLVDGGATYPNDVSGAGYVHNNTNGAGTAVLTGTLNTSGTFNFRNASAAFNFAGSGNSTLSGVIGPVGASGVFGPNATVAGGSIIKSGTGTLTLSGANAYTGSTTISGGTLRINSASGAIPNAGLVTLADASGVNFEVQASETIGALAGGGASGGAVSIDTAQTLTLSSGTQTYSGTIAGAGTLTNSGAIQTLNGALSHLGGLSVTSGVLTLGSASNSYGGATAISSAAGLLVTANGALSTTGGGNETTVTGTGGGLVSGVLGFLGGINHSTAEKIIGSGIGNTAALAGIANVQRGFIQSVSGNNTFAGDIELSGNGNSRIGTQDGAQLTLTGNITQGAGVTTAGILFRSGGQNNDFVTLSGTGNSFGADSSVFTGLAVPGQYSGLRIGADNAHPTNLTVQNFVSASGSSTALDLNGNDQALNGLASAGAGTLNVINLDTVNASTLTLNPTADKTSGANIVILGGSPGGTPLGVINLVKDGTFTQTLAGSNSYTGTTTVNNGTLTLGNAAALGASSASVAGGALNLNGQTITNAVSVGAAGTLTGSGSSGAATLAGGLTPGGSGSGLITLASATVSSTSVITLQLPATGTRGTNYDALTVSGALALDGTISVDITGLTPAAGQSFDLIDSTGSIDLTAFNVATDLVLPAPGGGLAWDTSAFASTGVVSIVNGDPFPAWAASKGLTGAPGFESGKTDDPDKDGRTNLDEFAFDGEPLSGANDGKVVGKIATVGADQVMTLTLPVRTGATFSISGGDQLSALIDGIYYRIEGSVDLSAFAEANVTEVTPTLSAGLPALSTGWTYRTFRAPGTVPTASKTFLRAKVSETP